jgi:DNA-binding transcriptional regulator LsrR (DeoR family)
MECFSSGEVEAIRARGAVADLCGITFAADGSLLSSPDEDTRRIGIHPHALAALPRVVAIAGGSDKHGAIAAILRSGFVDILITDAGSARSVLAGARLD